jgi:mono/diheme cytochrome c family protein
MSLPEPTTRANAEQEPAVGSAPAPAWLFILLGLLAFWGMLYLDRQGGGFQAEVYRPHPSLEELHAMLPKSESDILFANGRQVYGMYCSVCHQPTGQGLANQFPPLNESEWVLAEGPGRLIRLVLHGGQGAITVKGQVYNAAAMPALGALGGTLTDDEIAAVLTYVRQNQNWGNNASAVTPEQVKAVRDKTASRTTSWTPDELLQIPVTE